MSTPELSVILNVLNKTRVRYLAARYQRHEHAVSAPGAPMVTEAMIGRSVLSGARNLNSAVEAAVTGMVALFILVSVKPRRSGRGGGEAVCKSFLVVVKFLYE
ncbi:MAG: hypothetical protein ACYDEV_18045 [Acidiferrobacter sp.]